MSAEVGLRLEFADDFNCGSHVLHWRFRENAMAEIENVTRARTSTLQELMDAHSQLGNGREQYRGVEVPLYRRTVADVHPSLVDVDAPVDAHYVTTRGMQLAKKSSSAGAEVDHGNASGTDTLDQRA